MKSIPILYADDQLVVFDKPSGILVVSAPGKTKNILTDVVNEQCGQKTQGRLHPCHRLDQMTSGAIVFAWGKGYQQRMMQLFQKGAVEKVYIAVVKGRIKNRSGEFCAPIKDKYQENFARDSRAKKAVTQYRVLQYAPGITVVEVRPQTGRTNQIRIHFAQAGHPLLGERVYAFRRDFDVDMRRLALHSHRLRFRHPVSGKDIQVVSEMPEDMADFLKNQK